jgi:cytochrome c oxidase cbb3-type subunit III
MVKMYPELLPKREKLRNSAAGRRSLSLSHIKGSRGRLRASLLATFLTCNVTGAVALAAQSRPSRRARAAGLSADLIAGRQIFVSECASCHGLDARGGEHAPNILARPEVQRMSDADIAAVVRKGVPSRGMPAFDGTLDARAIRGVAAYLRGLLRGDVQSATLPGDPAEGSSLFFGKAGCAKCHMVNGSGGFLGADLSLYASSHSVDEIREAISNPNKILAPRERTVAVVTARGERLTGIARNEDNFSLQLQTPDGAFHLLMKSDLAHIDYPQQSLMPADYAHRLEAHELNDLISFLMRTAAKNSTSQAAAASRKGFDENR